jgi:hypothetical protein
MSVINVNPTYHIIIIGDTSLERTNMAFYVDASNKRNYKHQIIIGPSFPALIPGINYIFTTSSLKLIPINIQNESVVLNRPLVCL